jgi:DNA-binding YbaB/EbfC family protein
MKDLGGLMKQAQAMQQKLADAQAKIAELSVEGSSGGGMVSVTLKGTGDLAGVKIDPSLVVAEETDVLEDLLVAAHADAKRKLDAKQGELMREAAGPLAGMNIPGMPKF